AGHQCNKPEFSPGGFRRPFPRRPLLSSRSFRPQPPPLREREGDVGLILDAFLKKLNEENAGILWKKDKKLSPSARNLLLQNKWPGNIRELQNTLLRASVYSAGADISEEDVRQAIFPTAKKQDGDAIQSRGHFALRIDDARPLGKAYPFPLRQARVAEAGQ